MVSDRLALPTAARAALRTSRSTPGRSVIHAGSSRTTVQLTLLDFVLLVARVIGLDDTGHQIVAHDVLRREPYEAHAIDPLQRLDGVVQTRALAARQVGLAGVASDHHARAFTQPGHEHAHLHGRGILRLVQDYEAMRQRAAAHES